MDFLLILVQKFDVVQVDVLTVLVFVDGRRHVVAGPVRLAEDVDFVVDLADLAIRRLLVRLVLVLASHAVRDFVADLQTLGLLILGAESEATGRSVGHARGVRP